MNHLKQIAAKLPEYGVDAMMLTSAPGEFYAVGFHGEGIVLVAAGEAYYFTDSRYIEAAEKQVAGAAVAVTDRNRNYKAMVQEVIDRCGIKKLGFEEEYMSVAAFHDWKESLTAELVPAQKLVNGLRAAKDQEEIARMVQAQEITDRAFDAILKFIRPGMTEKEIAAKLEYDMLRFGAQRMSFEPIVVTGANGSLPHGIPGDTVVEPGSFLTMDFGCVCGGYCSDMTRTIAVGEPTEEMKKVYHIVLEAQRAGIAAARADVRAGKTGDYPRHLQNVHADSAGMEREQGYLYPHDFPRHWVRQQYLPDPLKDRVYYHYGDNKTEQAARVYWEKIKGKPL